MSIDNPTFAWGSSQYDSAQEMYKACMVQPSPHQVSSILHYNTPRELEDIIERFQIRIIKDYGEDEDYAKDIEKLKDIKTIDDMFEFTKKLAWDLWTAAPTMAELSFAVYKVNDSHNPEGLISNNLTGFCCYLLTYFFNVKEEAFMGFDT